MGMETCSWPECRRQPQFRGLCSMHYQRARYHGTLDEVAPPEATHCDQCGKSLPDGRDPRVRFCDRSCGEKFRYRAANPYPSRECLWCGKPIGAKRVDAQYCDALCGQKYVNKQRAIAARAEKVATRPPCPNCGKTLPVEKRTNSTYCDQECKRQFRNAQRYGLTREEFDQLRAQHNACAICGKYDWGPKGPQVDHDHETGRVRGILCLSCNNGLGRFKDQPGVLRRAAIYLEQ
jgi:hypothetical protein